MAKMEFRSSVRKLMAFFKNSRERWKGKCQQAKYQAETRCKEVQARGEHLQAQLDAQQKSGAIVS